MRVAADAALQDLDGLVHRSPLEPKLVELISALPLPVVDVV